MKYSTSENMFSVLPIIIVGKIPPIMYITMLVKYPIIFPVISQYCCLKLPTHIWLVVATPLKNISQLG